MADEAESAHRLFGAKYNNEAWELFDRADRTPDDDRRLLQLAHASYVHWSETGRAVNVQRAELLVACVHTALGDAEAGLYHARRCVELSESNGDAQTPFDRASAIHALARAHACAGDLDEARKLKDRAREAGEKIVNPQGKKTFRDYFSREPWYGVE